jgi:hypothetical protein
MKDILLVCTHNAGRSQVAQAFWKRMLREQVALVDTAIALVMTSPHPAQRCPVRTSLGSASTLIRSSRRNVDRANWPRAAPIGMHPHVAPTRRHDNPATGPAHPCPR